MLRHVDHSTHRCRAPHIYNLEDEVSIVLDGEIGFRSNDPVVVLGARGYIIRPRGEVHAMGNAGSTCARVIELITPAGVEPFFREFVDISDVRRPEPEEVAELVGRYELTLARSGRLPDVIALFNLTPPPG